MRVEHVSRLLSRRKAAEVGVDSSDDAIHGTKVLGTCSTIQTAIPFKRFSDLYDTLPSKVRTLLFQ